MWPWDWIIWAGQKVTGISQAVYDWVSSLIASVTSWVTSAVDSIWHTIQNIGQELQSIWNNVIGAIEHAVSAVYQWARNLIREVYDWASHKILDIWNWVWGVWDWVNRQISYVLNLIDSGIRRLTDWVNLEIWQPLYRLYRDIRDYFNGWIARIWQYIEHPELLVELIGGYLLRMWWRYVVRFAASIARFILRQMMSLQGEVFDLLEHILVSIL